MINRLNLFNHLLACLLVVVSIGVSRPLSAVEITVGTVEVSQRGYWGKDGTAKGSSVEIVSEVVKAAGFTLVHKIMPYPRLVHNLELGLVDVALLIPNDRVTRVAIPLVRLQHVDFMIVAKRGKQLQKVEQIDGMRVGYLRSSRISEKILEPLDVTRVEGDQYEHLIQMLMHDRIDALISTKYNLHYSMRQLGYSEKTLDSPLLMRQLELHLVYSKKNQDEEVMAALVKAADQLKSDGVVQEIIDRYVHGE